MVNQYVSARPGLRRRARGEGEGLTAEPRRTQRSEEIFGVYFARRSTSQQRRICMRKRSASEPRFFQDATSRATQNQSLFSDLCVLCGSAVKFRERSSCSRSQRIGCAVVCLPL